MPGWLNHKDFLNRGNAEEVLAEVGVEEIDRHFSHNGALKVRAIKLRAVRIVNHAGKRNFDSQFLKEIIDRGGYSDHSIKLMTVKPFLEGCRVRIEKVPFLDKDFNIVGTNSL